MTWAILGLVLGIAIGCLLTLVSVLVWGAVKLHQRCDSDSIYERPNYYHRSEN